MKPKTPNLNPAKPGQGYWVNRDSVDKIERECAGQVNTKPVYLALSRVMNDRKSRRFCTATITEIGYYCGGLRSAQVEQAYSELERIGLITRETVKSNGMSVNYITMQGDVRYE